MIVLEANSYAHKKVSSIFWPMGLIGYVVLMTLALADSSAAGSEQVKTVLLITAILLPGIGYLMYCAFELAYEIQMDSQGFTISKTAGRKRFSRRIAYTEVQSISVGLNSMRVRLKDSMEFSVAVQLHLDHRNLDDKSSLAFKALKVNLHLKVIALIRLLIESQMENPPREANFKEEEAFRIINGFEGSRKYE